MAYGVKLSGRLPNPLERLKRPPFGVRAMQVRGRQLFRARYRTVSAQLGVSNGWVLEHDGARVPLRCNFKSHFRLGSIPRNHKESAKMFLLPVMLILNVAVADIGVCGVSKEQPPLINQSPEIAAGFSMQRSC